MTSGDFDAWEQAHWQASAATYAEGFDGYTTGAVRALLDAVDAAATEAGGDLLDVGTGPGFVASAALDRGWRVTGLDVAPAMLQLAAGRAPGARFERGSAEQLPFPDASFDAVVANFVLLHVSRPEAALAEVVRVLRRGGRAAFTVWDDGTVNRALGVFHDALAAARLGRPAGIPEGPDPQRFADRLAFADLLGAAGLTDVQVVPVRWTFTVGAGAWWDTVLTSAPRTGSLLAGQAEADRARARDAYGELVELYQRGSKLALPAAAVLAVGEKP